MDDAFLRQLSLHVPPTDALDTARLGRIAERVAATMATWSSPASRAALAKIVGAAPLRDDASDRAVDLEGLYTAVAGETSTSPGTARELTQTVALALAHAIGPQARALLCTELPSEWSTLLEDPHDVAIDRRHAPPIDRQTLAAGRPGMTTSLADAQPGRAQADSVASSDDPGGDRKLSGAEGPTSPGHDLATGRR